MLQERRKNLSIIKVLLWGFSWNQRFFVVVVLHLEKKTSQTFRLLDAMMDSLLSSQSCERANKSRSWDLKKYGAEGHSPITFLYVRFVRDGVQPSIGSALFTYEGKPLSVLYAWPSKSWGAAGIDRGQEVLDDAIWWNATSARLSVYICIYIYIYMLDIYLLSSRRSSNDLGCNSSQSSIPLFYRYTATPNRPAISSSLWCI